MMCSKGIEFYFKSFRMGRGDFYARYYRLRLKQRRGKEMDESEFGLCFIIVMICSLALV